MTEQQSTPYSLKLTLVTSHLGSLSGVKITKGITVVVLQTLEWTFLYNTLKVLAVHFSCPPYPYFPPDT